MSVNVDKLLNLPAGGKEMLKSLWSQSPLAYLREMTGIIEIYCTKEPLKMILLGYFYTTAAW